MEKEPPPWQGKLAKPVQARERTLAEGEAETIESGSRRSSPCSSLKTLVTLRGSTSERTRGDEGEALSKTGKCRARADEIRK